MRQPLADHSGKTLAKEHQQFRAMASVQAQRLALPQGQQADRQGRLAIDADERLGANELTCWPEERMTTFHGAHFDARDLIDRSAEESRLHDLDAGSVGA